MSDPSPELTVVIPTRDRRQLLSICLERLAAADGASLPVEVIVADDGSTDGTPALAERLIEGLGLEGFVSAGPSAGPATARNRAIDEARGRSVLMIGDDVRARPELLRRHIEFHLEHPDPKEALLGLVVPAAPLDGSPFINWLHTDGVQFGYGSLIDGAQAPASALWTANVSVKTEILRQAGGFDEGFDDAALEDAELGLRLGARGMRLRYDASACAEHFHPTDLARTLSRMRRVGRSFQRFAELAPDFPAPRRPGPRHRLKATALRAAWLVPPLRPRVRPAAWRFLCDEVMREELWGGLDEDVPRIGRRLARAVLRDPLSQVTA